MRGRKRIIHAAVVVFLAAAAIGAFTLCQLQDFPAFAAVTAEANMPQLLDRNGAVLDTHIKRGWNQHDQVQLHQIPPLLQQAFIVSEDKRFGEHTGVDWQARANAMWQVLSTLHAVRGASTITEQVVRMIHPRPRALLSKWLETFEAFRLEREQPKWAILSFYLNQVPYGAERRGVAQPSRYYFNRDVDTLSPREQLALAVLARAPAALAKPAQLPALLNRIDQLATRLHDLHKMSDRDYAEIQHQPIALTLTPAHADVYHFAKQVWLLAPKDATSVDTTLDGTLQTQVTRLLNERIHQLSASNVQNGAVLIADHQRHEVLTWAVSGDIASNTPGAFLDAVMTPRQPGSSLKPFIYAMALEKGWTAATWLKDEPMETAVGAGMHSYHNFSHLFYGDITVREALANSLNIPAVKTLNFVGVAPAIAMLQRMGVRDLTRNPSVYGDGLALGNGEISLFELVQAYSVLADRGRFIPLRFLFTQESQGSERIFSPETSSIISNILSDPHARRLEFGAGSTISFPIETAVKTGTSTDHRDAWVVAYNHRYIVGIWMGNLTQEPMHDITGSTGPGLLAHSVFALLNKKTESKDLYLSPLLVRKPVCAFRSGQGPCGIRDEWFAPGTEPDPQISSGIDDTDSGFDTMPKISKPSDGLRLAMDPRVPDSLEYFEFSLQRKNQCRKARWFMDGKLLATTSEAKYNWKIERGRHVLYASVDDPRGVSRLTSAVSFTVK